MISLTTAKLLLLLALAIGPRCAPDGHSIEVVGKDAYCVWVMDDGQWTLTQVSNSSTKHWPFNGTDARTLTPNASASVNPEFMNEVKSHNWSQDAILNFPNGEIVEKQGNKIYYTVHAGDANQQVYTILTMSHGKTL